MEGRYINIMIPRQKQYLTLCEVKVTGQPSTKTAPTGDFSITLQRICWNQIIFFRSFDDWCFQSIKKELTSFNNFQTQTLQKEEWPLSPVSFKKPVPTKPLMGIITPTGIMGLVAPPSRSWVLGGDWTFWRHIKLAQWQSPSVQIHPTRLLMVQRSVLEILLKTMATLIQGKPISFKAACCSILSRDQFFIFYLKPTFP